MFQRRRGRKQNGWIWLATLVFLAGCTPSNDWRDARPDGSLPDGGTDSGVMADDEDGDGISDLDEGRASNVDTDGDGTPDYLDGDSDDDTIPDAIESGTDGNPNESPVDSDGDGTPNFRDNDSDDNGIFDSTEGWNDTDANGTNDYADWDNDGDNIGDREELGDNPSVPLDTDGDGSPDYLDADSDGDTIADFFEQTVDTDGDGTPDFRDDDSDGDGLSDSVEAGDDDLETPPVDSDGDMVPDFRDADSDNDGLSDAQELAAGSDPTNDDSDDDGVTDLVEVAAGTNPLDETDSPRTNGDFVFLVPYNEPPDPTEDTLSFSTDIQIADVYFLMDTTGSMGGEISNLASSLTGTVIPGIQAAIPDVWFGVGGFDDYPCCGYGDAASGDLAYYNLQNMTSSAPAAQSAVSSLRSHYGVDGPESHVPALHAIATGCGDGGGSYGVSNDAACTNPALIGYPHFRGGSVPIIILMTDALMHNGPGNYDPYSGIPGVTPPTYTQTVAALNAIHARVIGVDSGGGSSHLTTLANDTGTVGAGGPLVYSISGTGTGLGGQVVDAVEELVDSVPMDIAARGVDDASDEVDAMVFIDQIIPSIDAAAPCATGLTVEGNAYINVIPGSTVCFDIIPARNETVEPTSEPQIYMATVQVWGDDVTMLDEREVFFLIPPVIEGPGGPD